MQRSLPLISVSHLLSCSTKLETTVYSFLCIIPEFIYSYMSKYKYQVSFSYLLKNFSTLGNSPSFSSNQWATPSFIFLLKKKILCFRTSDYLD